MSNSIFKDPKVEELYSKDPVSAVLYLQGENEKYIKALKLVANTCSCPKELCDKILEIKHIHRNKSCDEVIAELALEDK